MILVLLLLQLNNTLLFKDTPLQEGLEKINSRFEIQIVYQREDAEGIFLNGLCEKNNILKFLSTQLEGSKITVTFKNNILILVNRNKKISIEGKIVDADTYEPIGNVYLALNNKRIKAGSNGVFQFKDVGDGNFEIEAKHVSYETHKENIEPDSTNNIVIPLKRKIYGLDSVNIDYRIPQITSDAISSEITLRENVFTKSASFNEGDANYLLQSLPGVKQTNDMNSQLYVRGGESYENLILLDGMRIFNPYHVYSLFSIFDTNILKKVDFSRGNYSAKYNGGLSSLINAEIKTKSPEETEYKASLGLFSRKLFVHTPFKNGNLLLSHRASHLKYIDEMFNSNVYEFPFNFYEYVGKINYSLNEKMNVSGTFLQTYDEFDAYTARLNRTKQRDWNSSSYNLKLNHVMGSSSELVFNHSFSKYNTRSESIHNTNNSDIEETDDSVTRYSHIKERFTSIRYNYFGNESEFNIGFTHKKNTLEYFSKLNLPSGEGPSYGKKFTIKSITFLWPETTFLKEYTLDTYATYIQSKSKLGERWTTVLGLKSTYLNYYSELFFEPKFSLSFLASDELNFTLSYDRYHQQLYTANIEADNFSYNNVYLVNDGAPILSRHLSLKSNYLFSDSFSMELEYFVKVYKNRPRLISIDESYKNEKRAKSSTELFLKYITEPTKYWLSATYQLGDYNSKTTLNFVAQHELNKKWSFYGKWVYGSNNAKSVLAGFSYNPGIHGVNNDNPLSNTHESTQYFPIYETKDLPDYHRLDLGLTYSFSWDSTDLDVDLGLSNVYARKNILYVSQDGIATVSPTVPTIRIQGEF